MKFNISGQFFETNSQKPNFMKIYPVEVKLFHADRRTGGRTNSRRDITKLIVALRNFAKAPNQEYNTETRAWSECKI